MSEDDVAGYLQEFLAVPGSSLVKVGSAAVQAFDVAMKIILQEHLVEEKTAEFKKKNGRKPNKAEADMIANQASMDSLKSGIDYKMNIPRELRILEQTGITSFVSFWARIQKIILTSARDNPVNAMLTILINEMLGASGATIFDASLFDRWENSSIAGIPRPGMDMIFPTKLVP